MNLDDILFMTFRHKWLLVSFGILALIGAVAVRVIKPPLYVSKAKLLIHYVTETKGVATDSPDTTIKTLDGGAQATIAAEIEILTSLDVAKQVAEQVGPARILARKGGGDDLMAAAGVVCSGIEVDPARSTIITVAFKHPDPDVVQPVLESLITAYMKQHTMIHSLSGVLGVAYSEQRDKLRSKLTQTEEELKRLKTQANVLFVEDSKKAYQEEIAKVQRELRETETELAVRKSVLGEVPQVVSSDGTTAPTPVPAEKVREYSDVCGELETLKRRYRELLREYTQAFPAVRTVREQIEKLVDEKATLTNAWPALALVSVPGLSGGTNAAGGDLAEEIAEVRKLTAKVAVLGLRLTNVQAEASRVMDLEPKITELTRQHDEEEATYRRVLKGLENEQMNEAMAAGKITNMSVVQTATLPGIDYKKFLKRLAIVMAACLGLGVALVLLFELVLDRTIKRTHDVERHLGMPIFLTIPDVNWSGAFRNWWRARLQFGKRTPPPSADPNGSANPQTALEPWKPENPLKTYADGLRERLVTYFEINNLNQKKPKLVAVTGCGKGSGVSTLAGGLAASLSKIGDGNVLLVDMNNGQEVAHSFYQGSPGCGLVDVLEPEARAEAQVQENLYLASISSESDDKLAKVVPSRFTHLVPKLKASDYDYIIFDMPPVSPTSSTPRLSSYMDIVLLVLESEKTGQQTAARAGALMREARANVAAVLNKYRPHVPQRLSQDL